MRHTQETWTLSHNTNWKTNPFSITVRKHGVHSATVANIPTRMTITPQEQQANARLIAAAPDLLDALSAMLAVCHDTERDDATVMAVAVARAALAKAVGGTDGL